MESKGQISPNSLAEAQQRIRSAARVWLMDWAPDHLRLRELSGVEAAAQLSDVEWRVFCPQWELRQQNGHILLLTEQSGEGYEVSGSEEIMLWGELTSGDWVPGYIGPTEIPEDEIPKKDCQKLRVKRYLDNDGRTILTRYCKVVMP